MPPQKSLIPKPRGPPRTPPELRSLKLSISFRADQKANLDRLKADHRLSLLCQQAVDLDAELEALPDSVRDDALEAAAAIFFDEWAVAGSYAISQDELIQHKATSGEMALDAEALGISSFELIEKGDLLRIDIPGMFFLEFDSNRKAATIQNVGHVESVEVQHAYHK